PRALRRLGLGCLGGEPPGGRSRRRDGAVRRWVPEVPSAPLRVPGVSEIVVRLAVPDDWPAVAGLLVELGRGVAAGTAEDPTPPLQFAGPIRRIHHVHI